MSLLDVPMYDAASIRRSRSERKPKAKKYVPDTIDRLDVSFGHAYHHQGPYDAALRSYNKYSRYAPLAATEEGNQAAWEATPREAQLDALVRGRPLDKVGIVPPGEPSINGTIMNYKEGADLMREPDAAGGAYKRWHGIQYHPDDLKGKGEPGFTIDNQRKAAKAALKAQGRTRSATYSVAGNRNRQSRGDYEMLMVSRPDHNNKDQFLMIPQLRVEEDNHYGHHDVRTDAKRDAKSAVSRHRSVSAVASSSRPREFAEGLKRRFGSLRRK